MTDPHDPGLEHLLGGWCADADHEQVRWLLPRLRPDLAVSPRIRALIAATVALTVADQPRNPATLAAAMTAAGHAVPVSALLALFADYCDAGRPMGLGLVTALEDWERQRLVARAQQLPLAASGTESLRQMREYLARQEHATVPPAAPLYDHTWQPWAPGQETHALPTGWAALDGVIGGLTPGSLVIVGARPGRGKSVFGLTLARQVAASGTDVLLHSLEMTRRELLARALAAETGIENARIRHGIMAERERETLYTASQALARETALHVWTEAPPWEQCLAFYAQQRALLPTLGLVIVDYLGLLRGLDPTGRMPRYQQLGQVTQALKSFAMQHQCVVMALSQLNRDVDEDEAPQLRHLRESGNLEQDADLVLLLHSPDPPDVDLTRLEVRVAKHRGGRTGVIALTWDKPACRLEDAA